MPWGMLDYDTSLEGFRTNLTQEQLRNAPSLSGIRATIGRIRRANGNCTTTTK